MALSFCNYIIKINVVNVLVDCRFTSCRSSATLYLRARVSLCGIIDLIDRLVMVKVGQESRITYQICKNFTYLHI